MIARCTDASCLTYKNYGGKGITVCARWAGRNGLENFIADMGMPPTRLHQLDRIDGTKGYSPENCRWVERKENIRNRPGTRTLLFEGKLYSAADIAEMFGISRSMVLKWKSKLKLTPDAIFARAKAKSTK